MSQAMAGKSKSRWCRPRWALEAVHRGVDEGQDEGEEIGRTLISPATFQLAMLAGDEHAPEPVGEGVHGVLNTMSINNAVLRSRIDFNLNDTLLHGRSMETENRIVSDYSVSLFSSAVSVTLAFIMDVNYRRHFLRTTTKQSESHSRKLSACFCSSWRYLGKCR